MASVLQTSRALSDRVDDVLRGSGWAMSGGRPARTTSLLLLFIAAFGLLYGTSMGAFGGLERGRRLVLLYSGIKVPMLLLVTFCLSLPSFWVLNAIAGLAEDFKQVVRALVATQAGLTIVLASLAPFTLVWYASFGDYHNAILFNAAMFAIASAAAQRILCRYYAPLIAGNPRHRLMRRVWLGVYAFVGIQMGWVLRPFVGDPALPVRFFRADGWGNAYVNLAEMIHRAV